MYIEPQDVIPMERFALKWRFMNPEHHDLSGNTLAAIRPLTEAKAAAVTSWAGELHGKHYIERFEEVAEFHVNGRGDPSHERPVTAWLHEWIPAADDPIVISWSDRWAAVTTQSVFAECWSAFLYPVEDVIITPLSEAWTLAFDYKQRFYLARARQL